MIADILDKPLRYEIVDFHSQRPGHDLRYGLDGTKMRLAGWQPPVGFENSLEKTIHWMIDPAHDKWLQI
jgi:dTDP-glucose 4,6-dehydratase